MSWAERLQAENPVETEEREQMFYLKKNIEKIKKYCVENRQDWGIFVTGNEGSGKSTMASHVAFMFEPEMKINESMIYSFREGEHSFLKFIQQYKKIPYKVAWYDEAVTVLFSLRHSGKDSADAQELFKLKRECRHYDILVSPSFWDIVPDIRERRIKSLLYCFTEVTHPVENHTVYKHKYAYYSGEKIVLLSKNEKAKVAFRSANALFKVVRPDFIEEFPAMNHEFEGEYLEAKHNNFDEVLERIIGKPKEEGIDKLLGCKIEYNEEELKQYIQELTAGG